MKNNAYIIPSNIHIFKSNYDYYNGIGILDRTECIERSLHISGIKKVDQNEYKNYIQNNQLSNIFSINL